MNIEKIIQSGKMRPLFNLYKDIHGITFPNSSGEIIDIAEVPFEELPSNIKLHVISSDMHLFVLKLLDASDVNKFMNYVFRKSGFFKSLSDGNRSIETWIKAVKFLILREVMDKDLEKYDLVYIWLNNLHESIQFLDTDGWIYILHILIDEESLFKSKTKFLESIPKSLTKVKGQTFRKRYNKLSENNWNWFNTSYGLKNKEKLQFLIEIWQY